MRIKKHANKNAYLLSESGVWVRDFTQDCMVRSDINRLSTTQDIRLFLDNELQNSRIGLPQVDSEGFQHRKVLVVSDGYDFRRRHRLCARLPGDVTIMGVNGALAKWELVGAACPPEDKRSMGYYVVNNPYRECLSCLPRQNRYYPKCIASARTNPEFTRMYSHRGTAYRYQPTLEEGFSGTPNDALFTIDDYRNPICSALGLAYRFDVEKVALLCCDDSFEQSRQGSVLLENGLSMYPQQGYGHAIIDGIIYWMTRGRTRDITVVDASSGPKYKNAAYIHPESLADYFQG